MGMSFKKLNNIKKSQKLAGIKKDRPKKKENIYNGVKYDSHEEIWFMWWLEELAENRIVSNIKYHGKSYNLVDSDYCANHIEYKQLKSKTKSIPKEVKLTSFREYTPDFTFNVIDKHQMPFFIELTENNGFLTAQKKPAKRDLILQEDENNGLWICYVDIKPAYMDHVASQLFGLQQSIMMEKHFIYVNKVVAHDSGKKPSCLFQNSFIPEKFTRTEVRKDLKSFKYIKHSLKDFIPF